jgi:hypothetical protein
MRRERLFIDLEQAVFSPDPAICTASRARDGKNCAAPQNRSRRSRAYDSQERHLFHENQLDLPGGGGILALTPSGEVCR